jgi:hypothetical protein
MMYYVWYTNYVAHSGIQCEYVSSCHVLGVVTSSIVEITHLYDFIIIGSSFQMQFIIMFLFTNVHLIMINNSSKHVISDFRK